MPRAIEAVLEHSAPVRSESVISEMETGSFAEDVEDGEGIPGELLVTCDLSEARNWLAEK